MANEQYLKIGSHNGFRWSAEKPLSEAMMAWFCDAYMCHSASRSHVSEHFSLTQRDKLYQQCVLCMIGQIPILNWSTNLEMYSSVLWVSMYCSLIKLMEHATAHEDQIKTTQPTAWFSVVLAWQEMKI